MISVGIDVSKEKSMVCILMASFVKKPTAGVICPLSALFLATIALLRLGFRGRLAASAAWQYMDGRQCKQKFQADV